MAIVSKKYPYVVTSTRDQHPTLGHRSDTAGSGTWPGVEKRDGTRGRAHSLLPLQFVAEKQ
jgi:hypothetical protein